MDIELLVEKYNVQKGDIAKAHTILNLVLVELIESGMSEFEAKKIAFERALEKVTSGNPPKAKTKVKSKAKAKKTEKKPKEEKLEEAKSKPKKATHKKKATTKKAKKDDKTE